MGSIDAQLELRLGVAYSIASHKEEVGTFRE
jgi:hypothetical protein